MHYANFLGAVDLFVTAPIHLTTLDASCRVAPCTAAPLGFLQEVACLRSFVGSYLYYAQSRNLGVMRFAGMPLQKVRPGYLFPLVARHCTHKHDELC